MVEGQRVASDNPDPPEVSDARTAIIPGNEGFLASFRI
jgi:hypothetical protein